jgi:predicted nuclease with TOPRIM domain
MYVSLKNTEKEFGLAQEARYTAEKQAQSVADALAQSKELANEYRSKNDALSTLATKNQTKADDYDKAIAQVMQLTNKLEHLTEKMELLKTDHQREIKKIADDLLRAQADARKDQAAMAEKLDFLEKSFQKERDSFDKEIVIYTTTT